MSDWFPHTARNVDKLAIIRSMWTTDSNHGAQTQFHTGRNQLDGDFPTLGGWVHYGLGSLNDELPQFISIGTREYWNQKDGVYLGPAHDAVPLRIDPANPLAFGTPDRPVSIDVQRLRFGLVDVDGGGHTWPGREPRMRSLGVSTRDISANDMMWEFFTRHPLP